MRPTVFQRAELRDENDNIIQQGTYGKGSALSNSTNDAWIDYVMNNLEALYGIAKDEVVPVSALPASGDMNKTYLLTTNGKTYRWSGTAWIEISSSEAVGRAEAAADLAEEWATKTSGAVDGSEYSAKHYSNVSKDWANKLNATVDGSEYSAKHYAGVAEGWAEDAEGTAEDIADHLAQIDQNTGGVSANSKRIGNIEKLLQGNLYDYDTDDNTAYTKTVPSGALPFAGLEKVGGKTIVWNQLVDSGTTTVPTISGRKYYTLIDGTASIVTSSGSAISIVDDTADMVCDLTLMFGSGSEPSTTADFTAIFGATHYSYNAGTLLSAGVTSVVSKDTNNATLQTYSIPAEVQALEGYGWGIDNVYNEVDIENKKYIKRINKYDFTGSEALAYYGNTFHETTETFTIIFYNTALFGKASNRKCISNNFIGYVGFNWETPFSVFFNPSYNDSSFLYLIFSFSIKSGLSTSSTNAEKLNAAKEWLQTHQTTIYYQAETSTETDISEYLTDDNLLNVKADGTLTFENQNGTDYRLPVPSEETYMIDLQEAIQ